MLAVKTSQGAWSIKQRLASGILFKRLYFFTTKREAISRFIMELRTEEVSK